MEVTDIPDDVILTPQELQVISELDSRQFGFLKLNEPATAKKRTLVLRAIKYLENLIVQSNYECSGESKGFSPNRTIKEEATILDDLDFVDGICRGDNATSTTNNATDPANIEPKTYCKLGHLHLLLEDYPKAMSAYQKFYNLRSTDYWKDTSFLYGQGLVYFHFNAFQWAVKAFQQVLYVEPGFSRGGEIHLRLGLMFKVQSDYESSLKHFQQALLDSVTASFSKLEIRFHVAHLYELQSKHRGAREAYDSLLQEPDLPNHLRADVLRQLGWMYHTVDSLGEKAAREHTAVQFLQKSVDADPKSGQSLYLLGRCFSALGKVHDAFIAYRNSVDKCEGNADTWCSIGVLYQQQNQPIDALQAYICAVQYDKGHTAAWTNLGILYETCNQPRDALACYMNASRGSPTHKLPNPALPPRIKFLQTQLANAPMPSVANKPRQLLSIEEAWNLPVTTDMSNRQPQSQPPRPAAVTQALPYQKYNQPQQFLGGGVNGAPPGGYGGVTQQGNDAKRFKADSPAEPQTKPSFYLSPQQLQALQYLQQNQATLSPQQAQQYAALQHNYRLMQQHQLQLRQQQQMSPAAPPPPPSYLQGAQGRSPQGATGTPIPQYTTNGINGRPFPGTQRMQSPSGGGSYPQNYTTNTSQPPTATNNNSYGYNHNYGSPMNSDGLPKDLSGLTPETTVSDQELQELISHREFATSLAEDLLNRLVAQGEDVMDELTKAGTGEMGGLPNTQFSSSTSLPLSPSTSAGGMPPPGEVFIKQEHPESKMAEGGRHPMGGGSRGQNVRLSVDRDLKYESEEPSFDVSSVVAADIISGCTGRGSAVRNVSLIADAPFLPPAPPLPPSAQLTKEQLLPPTPSVLLDNKKLAFSPQLQEFCLQHPIAVVRGLASALKLDLGLFSTKSLVEANPDQPVEVRTQMRQEQDENIDPVSEQKTWSCISHRSFTTVARFAQYQASSFQESLREEQERLSAPLSVGTKGDDPLRRRKPQRMLKFGTNVDISDERKWRPQLQELMKLPAFARVVSAGNMLSHVGHQILGMNTVQLYMKVPGCRTPGHQENNNFSSININIGPGDCEWFGVPDAYWGVIHRLCAKNGNNYLHGSWWPDLQELYEENVPVYRFLQKPGDMVWVNSGNVHWVQAVGWCNNIAWNVGPLTARQYHLAIERYEWNKLQNFKSIVPMMHLSWNLARNIKVSDPKLFELIKGSLMRSLRQVCLSLDFVKSCGSEPRFHGRNRNEPSHYCGVCELEVFDILFVKEQEKRHVVHCIDCARRQAPRLEGFVVLEEYYLSDMSQVYDNFVVHAIQGQTLPGHAPSPPPPACISPAPLTT